MTDDAGGQSIRYFDQTLKRETPMKTRTVFMDVKKTKKKTACNVIVRQFRLRYLKGSSRENPILTFGEKERYHEKIFSKEIPRKPLFPGNFFHSSTVMKNVLPENRVCFLIV